MGKQKTQFKAGDKFNRLTILKFSHSDAHGRRHFVVRCDCGNTKTVQGSLMSSGNTKSCGCFSLETRKAKRLPQNRGAIYQIVLGYKRHAIGRGYAWGLSTDDVARIISQPCHYCGVMDSNKKVTKNCKEGFLYNGIDRVNNKIGYQIDNCVPCCKQCNRAKGSLSKDEFLAWVKAMASQWSSSFFEVTDDESFQK